MDATQYADICKIGLEKFADDADALLRYLLPHKADLQWAAEQLRGGTRAASIDLLRLLEAPGPQFLNDAKRYLDAVKDDLLGDELAEYKPVEIPQKRQWWQIISVSLSLAISIMVALLGNAWLVQLGWVTLPKPSSNSTPASSNSALMPELPGRTLAIIHVVQLLVVGYIIYDQSRRLKIVKRRIQERKDIREIGQDTFLQFRDSWLSIWWMWLIFYCWVALSAWLASPQSLVVRSVSDGFDLVSGFAIWVCFFVLDLPSVKGPKPDGEKLNKSGGNNRKEPGRDRPFWVAGTIAGIAGGGSLVLSVLDRSKFWQLNYFGVALVGLYCGLALACLTGRLASHHIGIPRWMPIFLYLYSMIQLFYSFFDLLLPEWQIAIFLAALTLKVMLAFAAIDMFRYGGLDRYLKAADIGLLSAVHETNKMRADRKKALEQWV